MRYKICLTGASGFIGRRLETLFLSKGYEVRRLRRPVLSSFSFNGSSSMIGEHNKRLMSDADAVVHLAAIHTSKKKTYEAYAEEMFAVNCEYVKTLAREAAEIGIGKFIFVSTAKIDQMESACGPLEFINETSKMVGFDLYAYTKYKAEAELLNLQTKTPMRIIVLRPPIVYGPGVKGNFSLLIKAVRSGVPLPIRTATSPRSILGLENLVNFLLICITSERIVTIDRTVYRVADKHDISLLSLTKKIAMAYEVKLRYFPIPEQVLGFCCSLVGKDKLYNQIYSNALQLTNRTSLDDIWEPKVSIDEQLRQIVLSEDG